MAALRRLWLLTSIAPRHPACRMHVRPIHSTPVAAKKKAGRGASSTQMFSDAVEDEYQDEAASEEEELFGGGATSSAKLPSGSGTGLPNTPRGHMFDTIVLRTMKHFSAAGTKKTGNPPRRTVVQQLCKLAYTPEHLEKTLDVIALFRSTNIPVDTSGFLGRCMTLKAPALILRALQNRPKYGLDLPSLAFARTVLNALALQWTNTVVNDPSLPLGTTAPAPTAPDGPFKTTDAVVAECLAFVELYPLYGLPPVAQEPVSSIILAGVIAQRGADKPGDDAKADVAVVREYLSEIFGKSEDATATWDPPAGTSANEARWMRRSIINIMVAERKAGDVEPWVFQLNRKLKTGLLRT